MGRPRAQTVRTEGIAAVADVALTRWVPPAYQTTPAGRGLRQMLLRTQPEGYATACEALAIADLTRSSAALRVPTLVVVGELDPSTPVALSEALCKAIPGAQLAVIPGAAHLPMVDQPAAVTSAIRSFLAALAPGDDLAALGMKVRTEVLGADYVARATSGATEIDRDFQAYITRAAWGSVWARPHFDRRTRSIVTVALLAALGHEHELALHMRAMRNTGASHADITELLLHVAVYAGVPAANTAMRIAKQVAQETT
jgi:3-oxoadipate enol-lactonase/4-carboxymuconolactone decarboxylase